MQNHSQQIRACLRIGQREVYVNIDGDVTYEAPKRTDRIPTSLAIERAGAQRSLFGRRHSNADNTRSKGGLEGLVGRDQPGTANWTSDKVEIKYSTVSGKYISTEKCKAKWWQFGAFPGLPRPPPGMKLLTELHNVEIPAGGWVVPLDSKVFDELGLPFKTVRRESFARKTWHSYGVTSRERLDNLPYFFTSQASAGVNYVITMNSLGCGPFTTEIVSPRAYRPSVGYRLMTCDRASLLASKL